MERQPPTVPLMPPVYASTAAEGRARFLDSLRESDAPRIVAAVAICAGIFLLDTMTGASTMASQLYPVAFLALYGVRPGRAGLAIWILAVALIGLGAAPFDPSRITPGRALSLLMASVAAIAFTRSSTHERRLRRDALIDPLTGVFNRRSFLEISAREGARAQRAGSAFAVLMLDIDHFKRINDTYGHPAGDAAIKELADVAKRTLRPSDIVARYGGEEFVVSLPDTSQAEALVVAERLRAAVEQAAVISDAGAIRFTVSIGVTICALNTPLEVAIARADKALYAAKANGRNRVEINLETIGTDRTEKTVSATTTGKMRSASRILIVDDDDEIRELLAHVLKDGGYSVATATNAAEALRVIEADASVAVLFTDIVMPGELDGFALGRRAETLRPDLKVLYMSGYAGEPGRRAPSDKAVNVLQKPFRMAQVVESIEAVLKL